MKSMRLFAPAAILAAPYLALGVWLARSQGSASLAAYAASVVLLTILIAFLTRTWRAFFLAHVPVLLVSAAFTVYTLIYGHTPGTVLGFVLATSSWEELRGFFSIWQGARLLLGAVILLLVYLPCALLAPASPIYSGGPSRVRWAVLGCVVVLSAYGARVPAHFIDGIAANPVLGTVLFATGPLRQARAAVDGSAMRKVPYGAARVSSEEVHILIVGESARRDSWSVYGYARETTPYLQKLQGEAVFFRNALADANLTVYAVPLMLTGASPGSFHMGAVTGNLVDLAKEAGYSTAWLMNQDPHVSLLTGIHADKMVYPPAIAPLLGTHMPFDEVLLPHLAEELRRRGTPRFIGLHVMGSHWEYAFRYPPRFAHFGTKLDELDYYSALAKKPDQRVVDAYDNSVLYTDWFLSQVIEQARKLDVPATVTYFSDHGEDLYSLDGAAGHGTPEYSVHQFAIPAFVWTNSAYRVAHPDKVQALTDNAARQVRTHDVFYAVADLMGIHWPGAAPRKSFASSGFLPETAAPVIVGGRLVAPRLEPATELASK